MKDLLYLLFFLSISITAQNMDKGFQYLENQQYAEAETFFTRILENYPRNKTARLCYGRAIGLNGKPTEALSLFETLHKDHPENFEIKLNFAEAMLWNSLFSRAKGFYEILLQETPKSFPALLGYANTLSNLKEYESAIVFVNKALEVSPKNPNAVISKKYIFLGYAYQQQQNQQYKKSELLLKKNLVDLPNDQETLLNLANLYLIMLDLEKARQTYLAIGKNPKGTVPSLNGLSLVMHLHGKEKKALQTSTKAYELLPTIKDLEIIRQTKERYIQALLWNKKYKSVEPLINELNQKFPNENWILALSASLHSYKGDFKESLEKYNSILKNDANSFDGNLGKANVLKAQKNYSEAFKMAEKTLSIYNEQADAIHLRNNLKLLFTPAYDGKFSYSFDNG
ncbi:MAG: tetratricopeptide repeat protein, partial [Flavobacteriaceae bacterium]|nr:tetratricopeptide repeat protein [Flavobacteriaceae bacterium]